MAQFERIIAHGTFAEHLLVPGTGLLRLGEVVREVRGDESSRERPVARTEASLTSVILPSALIVTSGSRLASIKLRA